MDNKEFKNEFEYQETKRLLKDLLEKKVINKNEFEKFSQNLKKNTSQHLI